MEDLVANIEIHLALAKCPDITYFTKKMCKEVR